MDESPEQQQHRQEVQRKHAALTEALGVIGKISTSSSIIPVPPPVDSSWICPARYRHSQTGGKTTARGPAPAVPQALPHTQAPASQSTGSPKQLTIKHKMAPSSVPRWGPARCPVSWILVSVKGALACVQALALLRVRGSWYSSCGGGGSAECVSHLLFPINLSRQDLCLGSLLLEPETTNSALCQVFIPLSSILLFCLSPSMHFYCLPPFPSCNNLFFTFIPPFFLLTSSLSLVPPLLLARLSLFSLPHFLWALQWFFRFFPIYNLLSFPALVHPNLMALLPTAVSDVVENS